MPPSLTDSREEFLGEVANEYFEAVARGERPSLDEFADRYPAIADDLRELFPALAIVAESASSGLASVRPYGGIVRELGDFRIVREVGRGGMGIVYEAEQLSLGRRVALKVLPFAAVMDDKAIVRFKNEARAAATLEHPHIVPVFAVGNERGVYYYAMAFIEGQTLAEIIHTLRNSQLPPALTAFVPHGGRETPPSRSAASPSLPSSPDNDALWGSPAAASTLPDFSSRDYYRAVARLGLQTAQALHHAHERGVIHRDVKPGNLMLDSAGKLWVTDFGLARLESDANMTMTGDLVGTIRYMAPEQAFGLRAVDPRADVYALGVTLYELLALQPAFDGEDRQQLMQQLALKEPQPLRRRDPAIPLDLETIVAKAMAKEPQERYATADDLATDLERFLAHKPIAARRPSLADKVGKWTRRNSTMVASLAVAFLLLSIVLSAGALRVKRSESRAAQALEQTAEMLYASDMSVAYHAFEQGWLGEVRTILNRYRPKSGEPDRRGYEWRLLNTLATPPASVTLASGLGPVNELSAFPDGRRLASVGDDGKLRIWDADSQLLLRTVTVDDAPLHAVAVSPDGRYVAVGSGRAFLCDLEHNYRVTEIYQAERTIESIAFTPDGAAVALGVRYSEVRLVSLDGGFLQRAACVSRSESLEFLPHRSLLLTIGKQQLDQARPHQVVELRQADSFAVDEVLDAASTLSESGITVARPSPDGQLIIAGSRYSCQAVLFHVEKGEVVAKTRRARDRVTDVAYAPSGAAVAVAYRNGAIEQYRLRRPPGEGPSFDARPFVVAAHRGDVMSVRYLDDDRLATAGVDGRICLWELSPRHEHHWDFAQGDDDQGRTRAVALSPEGDVAIWSRYDIAVGLDVKQRRKIFELEGRGANFHRPAWSPSGNPLAILRRGTHEALLLDRSGEILYRIAHPEEPKELVFSSTGNLLAILSTNLLQLNRSTDGKRVFIAEIGNHGTCTGFSHDERLIAYGDAKGTISIVRVTEAIPAAQLDCESGVYCLAFSPDDSIIASGHGDGVIRLWDAASGRELAMLVGHARMVSKVAFCPDGRVLISAGEDGTVRLWSVRHQQRLGLVYQAGSSDQPTAGCEIDLSADGRRLAILNKHHVRGVPDLLVWDVDQSKAWEARTVLKRNWE